jgi:hypothetical protein
VIDWSPSAARRFVFLQIGTYSRLVACAVTPEGKRSMMKLSQRMVSSFCASLGASQLHRWTTLSGPNDVGVRVMVHRSTDPGQPSGVVLSASTSIWLPVPCDRVFAFVRDENTRSQVRVLSSRILFFPVAKRMRVLTCSSRPVFFAVGRAVARQPGASGVAHPERIAPRELRLLAKSKHRPPILSPSHGQLRACD